MTAISLDLSRVDELRDLAGTVEKVAGAVDEISPSWFLIGATARDILLHHACGLRIERMTRDVDVAVAVASWAEFRQIEARLTGLGYRRGGEKQRFFLGDGILDVVPFGAIERDNAVEWPPDGQPVMNVLGFGDVERSLLSVRLPRGISVRVPTIAGLTILKCLAWEDRHAQRPHHDSIDLRQLILSYSGAWNLEELYERGSQWVNAFNFEIEQAGAALLGFDMRAICGAETAAVVEEILQEQAAGDRLALDMKGDPDSNLRLLAALLAGLRDRE